AESQLISDFRNLRVLVVEDEPVNREVTLETLGNIWPSVDVAENGIEAVELAGKNQYGLISMDMQMPLMDGLEATRRIRLLANCRQIPIIAMTANAFAEDKTRCFAAGMNDFITKPMAPELFFSTLLTCLLRQE
ncbi:MAG: response regulator, partial [Azonexus sp.]|nr:response regulator [Azonexus sp.]